MKILTTHLRALEYAKIAALTTLVVVVLAVISLLNPNSAAASSGLSISPPLQELALEVNQREALVTVSLTNHTQSELKIDLSVVDFGSLGQSAGVLFTGSDSADLPEQYRLAKWIRLSDSQITIEPKSTLPITLAITNDNQLSPGGHYAAMIATVASQGSTSEPVALNQSLSSLLFVNKQGGEKYRLELKQAEVQRSWWGGITSGSLEFANGGNVHLMPRGTVILMSPSGQEISKGVINQESGFILPENSRIFHPDLRRLSWPLWPGTYTLVASYRYDGSETAEKQEFKFFHPGLVLPSLLPILLLIGGAFLLRRKMVGQSRRSSGS